VQTKTTKNRGLMGLTALAMLAMLVGLGWTVFQQNAKKTPPPQGTSVQQPADSTQAGTNDAAGTTDTGTQITDPTTVPATYTVKEGDSLSTIAAKFYGNANYYGFIERANNLVEKRDSLVVGLELKLPKYDDVVATN
jgi:nucleoid-associated protein YgaU